MALADLMVALREQRSVKELEKILSRDDLKYSVKTHIETSEGRMRMSNTSIRLGATEKDNRIIVDTHPSRRTIDLEIRVPHAFSLHLSTHDNGHITVSDVSGDFEINNVNGDIRLNGVSGSAVLIKTVNGDIFIRQVK